MGDGYRAPAPGERVDTPAGPGVLVSVDAGQPGHEAGPVPGSVWLVRLDDGGESAWLASQVSPAGH